MQDGQPASIRLPPGETMRQALGALRGYIYQLHQTLHAWLTLPPDEFLFLEVAEDYLTVARDAVTLHQVKATQAPVSLRSKGAVDAIESLLRHQAANPDRIVRLTYLTTAKVGRERSLFFPDGAAGLSHWQAASRDGADVSAIRIGLLALPLSSQVHSWIEQAEPGELRERLLTRIRWACDAQGLTGVNQAILDRIVLLGPAMGFQPSDAMRVRDALLAAVLKCVAGSSERRLARPDLLRKIEDATSLSMPLSTIRGLGGPMAQGPFAETRGYAALIPAESLPMPVRVTERRALVESLLHRLSRHGALWLNGSSGVGKTILARLVALASGRPWLILQLRHCAGMDLDGRLAAAQEAIATGRAGGIVLDDLPQAQLLNARTRLSAIGEEARGASALVIVTCAKPPPPSVGACLGGMAAVTAAPYLELDEVAAMVAAAGGNPEVWARVIHAFCGRGHPQLVDARIDGLSRRRWPADELLAGVGPGPAAAEIEAEREAIRAKLLGEVPEEASGLLYRLSMVGGAFDRTLALALARVEPRTRRPGEALEILAGPWIEGRGEDRHAISPLLDGIGERMLDDAEQGQVLQAIVDDLMERDPFPGDFAGYFLVHALRIGHEDALLRLALMILPAKGRPEADDRAMARAVGVLASLDGYDRETFVRGDPRVSVMLRLAQFRVAALARPRRMAPIAARLLTEARQLTSDASGSTFLPCALATLLMETSFRAIPRAWIGWLEELRAFWVPDAGMPIFLADRDASLPGTGGWTYLQHLFAARAASLADIGELRMMLDEVLRLGPARGAPYVEVLDGPANIASSMMQACWLEASDAAGFDARASAMAFHAARRSAEGQHFRALAVACGCIHAAILDEFVGDAAAAGDAIEALSRDYPGDRQVARARTNLQHRRGLHGPCVASARSLAEGLILHEGIEMAAALRGGALSAGALGDLATAGELFHDAHRAVAPLGMMATAFAVGLLADASRCAWEAGTRLQALHGLACAVIASESIDPNSGPAARWCVKALAHVILHLQGGSSTLAARQDGGRLPHGFCSRLDPPAEIMGEIAPSTIALWYMLAALEGCSGENLGIFATLRRRTAGNPHALYETVFAGEYLGRHIRRLDAVGFLGQLPEFARYAGYVSVRQNTSAAIDIAVEPNEEIPALAPEDWSRAPFASLIEEAVLSFEFAAVARGRPELIGTIAAGLRSIVAGEPSPRLGLPSDDPPVGIGDPGAAAWSARRLAEPRPLDPDTLMLASACMWSWLGTSPFREELAPLLADLLARRWIETVAAQGFRLRSPRTSGRSIAAVAESGDRRGRARIAELILAAEGAVRHRLSDDLRGRLRACCREPR